MTHPFRPLRAFALTAALLLAWLLGCTQDPGAPDLSNPLDPDGPQGGDPFNLVVGYLNGAVLVRWDAPGLPGIVNYEVLHSLVPEGPFSIVGSVEAPAVTFSHTGFAPNRENYYKVRATDALGAASAVSHIQAVGIAAPPLLTIGEGSATATRQVDLFIRAAVGDRVEVDSLPDFSTSTEQDLDENGEATLAWDLGTAAASDEWKYVNIRIWTGAASGDAYRDSIKTAFAPDLRLEGDPVVIGSLTPALQIDGDGVTGMRFADSREALDLAAFITAETPYAGYLLDEAVADSQLIYGEFACDFGFTRIDSVWAVPDSLATIELKINNGAESTADLDVQVGAAVAATQMRFAQTVEDLAAAAWMDYASVASFTLNGCEGGLVETIHGQFRNDWFSPDPVSDDILWLPPEVLDVTIAVPDTVDSGELVAITGTAIAGTCTAPLDLVEFDSGDGWTGVTGLETWGIDWTAPTVEALSSALLKARVTAGAETDSVVVEVLVRP